MSEIHYMCCKVEALAQTEKHSFVKPQHCSFGRWCRSDVFGITQVNPDSASTLLSLTHTHTHTHTHTAEINLALLNTPLHVHIANLKLKKGFKFKNIK